MSAPSPPTRPALRARYDARRREVVATAARLFAERGYDGTSMSELTAATGLGASLVYPPP
jgi:TetR/AcrR family transcriptional regulator, cholesterol catabolism regulator